MDEYKYVDIQRSIRESNSKFLKRLPLFVISLLKSVAKQNEMNRILNKYSDCTAGEFLKSLIAEFNLKLEIEGRENLPESGRCFFIANHPFGFLDGLILTHIVMEKYGSLKAIANNAFMLIPQLHTMVAAVDVFDKSSKAYIKALGEVYDSDVPITHFPAGLVARFIDGEVQDLPWQKSFVTKAVTCRRDIVPFYFSGQNSRLFYTIYRLRKVLGIKVTIELILLPRELFRKRNSTVRVRIGKPISYQALNKSRSPQEWTNQIRSQLYDMKKHS